MNPLPDGVWYNKDGSKNRESVYENGKLHGTEYRYQGRKAIRNPLCGRQKSMACRHGTMRRNKKEETPYVDGKRHGTEVEYLDTHVNGHKWRVVDKWRETTYVDDKIHGMQIRYHGDGSVEKVTPYENGKEHGMEIWHFKDGSTFNQTLHKRQEAWHGDSYREDGSKWIETPWGMANASVWRLDTMRTDFSETPL